MVLVISYYANINAVTLAPACLHPGVSTFSLCGWTTTFAIAVKKKRTQLLVFQ